MSGRGGSGEVCWGDRTGSAEGAPVRCEVGLRTTDQCGVRERKRVEEGLGGCWHSVAVNDRWDCKVGRADSVVLTFLAGASSEFGTFGTACG
jgi:hypothetical protein